jgi:hypothetical protein
MEKYFIISKIKIEAVKPDNKCLRLVQYGKGQKITCSCLICKNKNQTPEEAKAIMDKIYN